MVRLLNPMRVIFAMLLVGVVVAGCSDSMRVDPKDMPVDDQLGVHDSNQGGGHGHHN